MAGGEGTGLRPLTCSLPKSMVPVGNRPILQHVLGLLVRHGCEEALITLHARPQAVRDWIGDGSAFGLRARCFVEDVPLGTAGSLKSLEAELAGETFVVLSGDILTGLDLGALIAFHRQRGAAATVALTSADEAPERETVVLDEDGRVTEFAGGPARDGAARRLADAGVYVIEPAVLGLIEPGRVWDLGRQLFPALREAGMPVFGSSSPGYWCDVSNLARYLKAHADVLEGRTGLDIGGTELMDRVWAGPGVEIGPGVELSGPILLGPGTYLGSGARIEGPAVLGREVVVGGQASVKRSVLGDHSYVGRLAEVRGAILGRGVRLQNRSSVFDGAVLADEVQVGDEAVVKPNVKVWPGRTVAPEAVLGDSLVWGQSWGYGIFGESGVTGTINVDLGPELAARLGAVFGAELAPGAAVVVGADGDRAAGFLRDALVAGLGLAGCAVWSAGDVPAVAARHAVTVLEAQGGVYVGAGEGEGTAAIRLLGPGGDDLGRDALRRLERAIGGEDFRRASPERVGRVSRLPGAGEAYLARVQERGRNLARKGLVVAGAYADPWLASHARDLWRAVDVAHLDGVDPGRMRETGAAFGFEVDRSGEVLGLTDNLGRTLSAAQTWLVLSAVTIIHDGLPLVVPSNFPRAVAERLAALGARPVPCRGSRPELMARMRGVEEDTGSYLFRQSELVHDALMGAVALLDYLADTGETLAELVDESPLGEWVHLRVRCPWEVKGRVMSLLREGEAGEAGAAEAATADGEGLCVETQQGRVLVLPDADRPAFHVYSEAATAEAAEEMAGFYAGKVRDLAGLEDQTGISPSGGQS